MQGGRFRRGWVLAKQSWAVLRADRSLALFPVVSVLFAVIASVAIMAPGVVLAIDEDGREWILIPFALVAAYAATFVAVFCNVALAACVTRALQGEKTSVGQGLRVATRRTGKIAAWALVQATVGLILNAVQTLVSDSDSWVGALIGAIISGLLNFAWAVMTFFVVPVLALEGLGPIAAIKRSTTILRSRWGEGFSGTVSISGTIFVISVLPALLIGGLGGYLLARDIDAPGIALLVVAGIVMAVGATLGSTLQAIFRVALYRFATTGDVSGGFDAAQLESTFAQKKQRARA